MNGTVVEAVVHVEGASRLGGGHAEAGVVRRKVAQLGAKCRVSEAGRVCKRQK